MIIEELDGFCFQMRNDSRSFPFRYFYFAFQTSVCYSYLIKGKIQFPRDSFYQPANSLQIQGVAMRLFLILLLALPFLCQNVLAQHSIDPRGKLLRITSAHTAFPHPDRYHGYDYRNKHFTFKNHYDDSTVAIFVPHAFKAQSAVNLFFYFHGWWNSIDKSLKDFKLIEQFISGNKNAIFVFPEGARNAADSFGGKLEQKGTFKKLVSDVLHTLQERHIIQTSEVGTIILAGHSGAYRVMAFILNRGGLTDHIKEVYLFDALYDQIEKYAHWITHYNGRFLDIVTPNGGTKANSEQLFEDLQDWGFKPFKYQGNAITATLLNGHRQIFIFTDLKHSEVMNPYLGIFLQSSTLPQIGK